MKNNAIYYSVGPLLYCPANKKSIAASLIQNAFGKNYSLAFCLEDTISDNCVKEAETILIHSLKTLFKEHKQTSFFMPKIFIRVRSYTQIAVLCEELGEALALVYGFIIPKFSLENADAYITTLKKAADVYNHTFYMLPILESAYLTDLKNRINILYALKEKLASAEELILNIRVGGNDLCHIYGFRRSSTESIHQLSPIAQIFSDIVTVFGKDYVISGPVWEYYQGENWENGLINELNDDRLCGFIGKTVIHPNQIPVVNKAYQVSKKDYEDACAIKNWDTNACSLVAGSVHSERMNEYKTHYNWAEKIIYLADIYGIKQDI